MSWTRLGLVMYICAILNYCYVFYSYIQKTVMYSYIQKNFINTIISTATYLILIYAVAHIEEEQER